MGKVLVVNGNDQYNQLFKEFGEVLISPKNIESCRLVVFTGGEDVSPAYYRHKKLPQTMNNIERDKEETIIYTAATILDIPMVGICRGAQFLCAMNNGYLAQHVTGHTACTHDILSSTHPDKVIPVKGDHHQMMLPEGDFILEAWAESLSVAYHIGDESYDISKWNKNGKIIEPEVVFWPSTHSLGIQYHPEWEYENSPGHKYFHYLMEKYILN